MRQRRVKAGGDNRDAALTPTSRHLSFGFVGLPSFPRALASLSPLGPCSHSKRHPITVTVTASVADRSSGFASFHNTNSVRRTPHQVNSPVPNSLVDMDAMHVTMSAAAPGDLFCTPAGPASPAQD